VNSFWDVMSRFANIFVWWTVVAPWEEAIRVRLGNRVHRLGPGFHLRIPHIDMIFRQTIRMRVSVVQLQTLSTKDGKTVTLCATIGYCISDIVKLYNTLHHADETIRNIVSGSVASIVRDCRLEDCKPSMIEAEVNKKLDLEQYGLGKAIVTIVDFAIVKTYRLMSDQRWQTTDNLDTSMQHKPVLPS
jgi:regulator of protease activity HflC (stomatin/prohibitin superfamily)